MLLDLTLALLSVAQDSAVAVPLPPPILVPGPVLPATPSFLANLLLALNTTVIPALIVWGWDWLQDVWTKLKTLPAPVTIALVTVLAFSAQHVGLEIPSLFSALPQVPLTEEQGAVANGFGTALAFLLKIGKNQKAAATAQKASEG